MSETIEAKRCPTCKKSLPVSAFSKNRSRKDRLDCQCKSCNKGRKKKYRQSPQGKATEKKYRKSEDRKGVLKKYNQSSKGKATAARHAQTEKGKATQKRYKATEKGKATVKRASMNSRLKHPDRRKARDVVNNAVKRGTIPPITTQICEDCGKPAQCYHHFLGYSSEHHFGVVPVCFLCDKKRHKSL